MKLQRGRMRSGECIPLRLRSHGQRSVDLGQLVDAPRLRTKALEDLALVRRQQRGRLLVLVLGAR